MLFWVWARSVPGCRPACWWPKRAYWDSACLRVRLNARRMPRQGAAVRTVPMDCARFALERPARCCVWNPVRRCQMAHPLCLAQTRLSCHFRGPSGLFPVWPVGARRAHFQVFLTVWSRCALVRRKRPERAGRRVWWEREAAACYEWLVVKFSGMDDGDIEDRASEAEKPPCVKAAFWGSFLRRLSKSALVIAFAAAAVKDMV